MPERNLLIILRSPPYSSLDTYEGTRAAAGLIEHKLRVLYTGDGVYGAIKDSDHRLTAVFLSDLPDLGVELYADAEALAVRGLAVPDLLPAIKPIDSEKIAELLLEAEASLAF